MQAQSRARDAGKSMDIRYVIPEEGANLWFDMLAIPKDASNVEQAHAFINYLMEPEVAAKGSNFTNYANGNAKSKPFLDPAVANNPAVYPDAETMSRLYTPQALSEEQERALTRVWTDVKSG